MRDFQGDPADICQSCRHDRGSHLCGSGSCGFCPCATFAADPASIYAPALERLTDELVGRIVAAVCSTPALHQTGDLTKMIYRVTITDSRTGELLWTRDYATRPAAMKYIKAAVRMNTKGTVRRMKDSTCAHCGESIHRWQHGRKWYNRNESATCDRSPIGLHQWDGAMAEVSR